jgi:hypothetical protein
VFYDLSAVTDALLGAVQRAWPTAPLWSELGLAGPSFTPTFTGLPPDTLRDQSGPQLSLFLYHLELNNTHEATFWAPQMVGAAKPPTSYMPLALNLYYLLSTHSASAYAEEQQAISIAMRLFHASPIVSSDASATPAWQVNLTLENRSYDELSHLWQATTAPLRLAAVYRAAVVFLTPETAPADPMKVATVRATLNGDTTTVTKPPGS